MDKQPNATTSLNRRRFIGGIATAAAGSLLPGCKFVAGSGSNTIPEPINFPNGIELYQQAYNNWAREIKIIGVWFCSPKTAGDVVTLANWAHANNYRLRPFGSGHGFAPTLLPRGHDGRDVVLVNTHDHLNQITVNASDSVPSVSCGAGAYLEDICARLEAVRLGFYHTTAPGDISIAGALAINAHGAAIPKRGENLEPGHSFGTLSNLVLELTALVWDEPSQTYQLQTFQRNDPAIGPLLTNLARIFITDVKLQVGPNLKFHCMSKVDIPTHELLAMPEQQTANSFAQLSDQYGTLDCLIYPFSTDQTSWIKIWTVAPEKPPQAREVSAPYNYSSPELTPLAADVLSSSLRTFPSMMVPRHSEQSAIEIKNQMADDNPATQVHDVWGSAYTTTCYVKPSAARKTVAAWGIIIARHDLQRALSEFYRYFNELISGFQASDQYPCTGPVEIRATGLDHPSDVLIPDAVEPTLSSARPHPDHPEKDTIIWLAIHNNVDQPNAAQFNSVLEQWILDNYAPYAIVRPEWSKGYAYSAWGEFGGAWTNYETLLEMFPETWRNGYAPKSDWDTAVTTFKSMDPHGVFSNDHLDRLFPW